MFSNVYQCYLLSFSLSLSLTISLSHSFNLSLNHSWHAGQILFSSLCSKLTLTLSHSLSISHSFSLSHSFNLSFNHSRHAEQLLFSCLCSKVSIYRWKWQCGFLDRSRTSTLSCEFRVHWAGSQLKIYLTDVTVRFGNTERVRSSAVH